MTIQKFRSTAKRMTVMVLSAVLIAPSGYGQDDPCAGFPKFSSINPLLSDDAGWNKEMYYSTIQTADIDGDGQDELVARTPNGVIAWRFDPVAQTWIAMPGVLPLTDALGFNLPQYYSTMQFAVMSPNSSQASLLIRGAEGMYVYRYDTQAQDWVQIGPDAMSRPFPDATGWTAVENYSTIQTADLNGDKIPELIGREMTGLQVWSWDEATGTWGNMVQTDLASDAGGYSQEQYYYPIMYADLNRDGRAKLLLRTGTAGVQAYEFTGSAFSLLTPTGPFVSGFQEPRFYKSMRAFHDAQGTYILSLSTDGRTPTNEQLVLYTWNGAAFANETVIWLPGSGWDQLSQLVTIQPVDLNGDGNAEILARGQDGVHVFQRTANGTWTDSPLVLTAYGNTFGFSLPQSYWTIQPAAIQVSDQGNVTKQIAMIGRGGSGITTFWLTSSGWIGGTTGFPAWANASQNAAYAYISQQLTATSDIRSTYNQTHDDQRTYWNGIVVSVTNMTYPSSGVPGSTAADFEAVRRSMQTELGYVLTVYNWFANNKAITDYMYSQSANRLTAVTTAVQLNGGSTSSVAVALEWLALVVSILGTIAGGLDAGAVAAVIGLLATSLSTASSQLSPGSDSGSMNAAVNQVSTKLSDQQTSLETVNACRIADYLNSYPTLKTLGEVETTWKQPLSNVQLIDLQARASAGLEAWMYSAIAPAAWEIWTCNARHYLNSNCPYYTLPAASIWTWDQKDNFYSYLALTEGYNAVPTAAVLNRLFGAYSAGGLGVSLNDVYFGLNGWALSGTMSCTAISSAGCGPDAPMPAYSACIDDSCPSLPGPISYGAAASAGSLASPAVGTSAGFREASLPAKARAPYLVPFYAEEDSQRSLLTSMIRGLRDDVMWSIDKKATEDRMLAPLDLAMKILRQPGAVPEGYIDNLLRTFALRGELVRDKEIPSIHLNRHTAKAHAIRERTIDRTAAIQALGRPKR